MMFNRVFIFICTVRSKEVDLNGISSFFDFILRKRVIVMKFKVDIFRHEGSMIRIFTREYILCS